MVLVMVYVFSPWLVSLLAVFPVDHGRKNWQHFFHFSSSFLPNTICLFSSYALSRGLRSGAPDGSTTRLTHSRKSLALCPGAEDAGRGEETRRKTGQFP